MITLHNRDCLEAMREMKDNEFDLAIVDPPYGIHQLGAQQGGKGTLKDRVFSRGKYEHWDIAPPKEYFEELMRVSRNQIIWGANYFIDHLYSSRVMICWDKCQPWENFAQFELAWTSFSKCSTPSPIFKYDNRTGDKIHPTQKPVALYLWLLQKFAKEGDRILDTHLGSGSITIACNNLGFSLTAYELDKEYYINAKNRLIAHQKQLRLF